MAYAYMLVLSTIVSFSTLVVAVYSVTCTLIGR